MGKGKRVGKEAVMNNGRKVGMEKSNGHKGRRTGVTWPERTNDYREGLDGKERNKGERG